MKKYKIREKKIKKIFSILEKHKGEPTLLSDIGKKINTNPEYTRRYISTIHNIQQGVNSVELKNISLELVLFITQQPKIHTNKVGRSTIIYLENPHILIGTQKSPPHHIQIPKIKK